MIKAAPLVLATLGLLGGCSLLTDRVVKTSNPLPPSAEVDVPVFDAGSPTTQAEGLDSNKSQPYRFADVVDVDISPSTHGVWSSWDENLQRWRLEIRSENARSLNLHFGEFLLPSTARLTIYNPERPGAMAEFTAANNKPHGQLWTPQFEGERVLIDLIVSPTAIQELKLRLNTINTAFR